MKTRVKTTKPEAALRVAIGKLFETLPALENIELSLGGQRYRAHRSEPWVCMDVKAKGRGWECWTEYGLPAYHEFCRRQAMAGIEPWASQAERRT